MKDITITRKAYIGPQNSPKRLANPIYEINLQCERIAVNQEELIELHRVLNQVVETIPKRPPAPVDKVTATPA